MSRSPADLSALNAELTNDPAGLGLTLLPADDEANAIKLNTVSAIIQIRRRSLSTADIFNAVPPLEHQSLTAQQARWFDAMLSLYQIDPFLNTGTVAGLLELFGQATQAHDAIDALLNQAGNRINQMYQSGLLSHGGNVTPSDIANARQAA